MITIIEVTDLKPEQIKQIQAIIEQLKSKNELDHTIINQDESNNLAR